MIELAAENRLTAGSGSYVFQHPHDDGLLLKVFKPGASKQSLKSVFQPEKRRYGRLREWFVEYHHYIACLHRKGRCPDYLPRFCGFTDTSLGPAQVVEKISDEASSSLALTMKQYLAAPDADTDAVFSLSARLFDAFGRDRMIFRDLNLSNICVVRDGGGTPERLVVVDGLGDFTLIPLRTYSDTAYRKWHRSAHAKFDRNMRNAIAAR